MFYKISSLRMHELLKAELELKALKEGHVEEDWPSYEQSIKNYLTFTKAESLDELATWCAELEEEGEY